MTLELFLLSVYVLSCLTVIGNTIFLEEELQVSDVILSLLPVLNTLAAIAGLFVVAHESGFFRKTIWRKK